MPYTGMPGSLPVDACRLEIGDIDPDFPILADSDYEYFLSKNSDSIRRASVDAAKTAMFALSRFTRERVDVLEIYGNQWVENYRAALKMYISDPNFSVATNFAMPFAGGITKSVITANIDDVDAQVVKIDRSIESDPGDGENPFVDIYDTTF